MSYLALVRRLKIALTLSLLLLPARVSLYSQSEVQLKVTALRGWNFVKETGTFEKVMGLGVSPSLLSWDDFLLKRLADPVQPEEAVEGREEALLLLVQQTQLPLSYGVEESAQS